MNPANITVHPSNDVFHEGEEVVLAHGTYQGTLGVFVKLSADVNWAYIKERNGATRCHPLVWLQHSISSSRPSGEIASAKGS